MARRVLLLVAILVGLAAIVASVSRPRQTPTRPPAAVPPTGPSPTLGPAPPRLEVARLRFGPDGHPETARLRAGRPAEVTVAVAEAGEVQLEGLGLAAAADPLTPASFQVLQSRPGRFPVRFTSARGDSATTLGTLVVERP